MHVLRNIWKKTVMSSIPSVIKWTGSKRKQAKEIISLAPNHDRYIEPFLGGGSVLFLAADKNSIGSDIYKPLVDLWLLVKEDPYALIDNYSTRWSILKAELDELRNGRASNSTGKNIPETYYTIRDSFNDSPNPLDLNFILRTCVNGIVRFNTKGEFNNSFHLSRDGMKPETFAKNVLIWHEKIQNVQFFNQDYEDTINLATSKDFVYLDPPYFNSKNRYIDNLDFDRLLKNLEYMNSKSIKWALSFDGSRNDNSYEHFISAELYKNKYSLKNGISTMRNTLSKQKEYVLESLYTNY